MCPRPQMRTNYSADVLRFVPVEMFFLRFLGTIHWFVSGHRHIINTDYHIMIDTFSCIGKICLRTVIHSAPPDSAHSLSLPVSLSLSLSLTHTLSHCQTLKLGENIIWSSWTEMTHVIICIQSRRERSSHTQSQETHSGCTFIPEVNRQT